MNNRKKTDAGYLALLAAILILLCTGCKKYLDAKPDKKLVIPSTIADLTALLANKYKNGGMTPCADEASADNYFLPLSSYNVITVKARMAYLWQDPPNQIAGRNDWARIYNSIYFPNVCLDALPSIPRTAQNAADWDNVKGCALFMRSLGFLRGVLIFAKPYDQATAQQDYGIVLKLNSDFNEASVRASIQQTYDQLIGDLKQAIPLLPVTPKHVIFPSRPAAYGLLARAYLSMRMYDSCFKYANLCLQLKDDLMDYNNPADVNIDNLLFPFTRYHKEVLFNSSLGTYTYEGVYPAYARVDSVLYDSYEENDLRKKAFFTDLFGEGYVFQGTYDAYFSDLFVGVATDEIWLMRAETNARLGNTAPAMDDLNHLLQSRWKTGTFVPFTASSPAQALQLILTERRKELIFRGLRWMDLKRLNMEGANITLTRKLNGQTYTLPPNDKRYALLIPEDIIIMTGMPQNSR